MIKLTKINNTEVIINAEEIEMIETLHDTIITFCSGKKLTVKENAEKIVELVIDYKRQITPLS